MKLDMFYNLLVKDILEDDGESSSASDKPSSSAAGAGGGDAVDSSVAAVAAADLENSKTAIEVSQTFSQSSNYFLSYFLR